MLLSNTGQSILEDRRSQIKDFALVFLRFCREKAVISQGKRGPGH